MAPALAFLAPTPVSQRASNPAAAIKTAPRTPSYSPLFQQQAASPSALSAASGFPFDFFSAPQAMASTPAKVGTRKIVVVTGTSSGLGRATVKALAAKPDYYVICAVRDVNKMKAMAPELGLDERNSAIMELDVSPPTSRTLLGPFHVLELRPIPACHHIRKDRAMQHRV
jgi:hypothetical protein